MMKRLGTKLSSKSTGSQSSSSSVVDTILFGTRSYAPPPIPEFQRQEIPPHTLLELRLACAEIVKETGPSGAELEAILNQLDPLEQYKKEEQHRKDIEKIRLQAARTHASAFPPVRGARERTRLSKSNLDSYNASSTSLVSPQPVAKQPNHRPLIPVAKEKTPVDTVEAEQQPLRRAVSRKPVPGKDDIAIKTRSQHETRLKSADGAAGPHHSRTAASSTSTTRSNTTADNHASTTQTSFAQTPADHQRSSLPYPLRSASQSQLSGMRRQNEQVNTMSSVDIFSSPNPDYEIPSLYHVKGGLSVPSRSRSRAGSIKDSIIGGIRDYMQPRASLDRFSRPQSRQSRSTTRDNSRTPSRASSMTRSSKEWMRNAASSLRRKGSISSLISQRGDGDDRGRKKDKSVDLNRSLPPLPGLDSYKEPKKHIAQLLARPKFSNKTSTDAVTQLQEPTLDDSDITPQTASQSNLVTQSATSSKKVSPETTSSRQFPRIPFAETGDDMIDHTRSWPGTKEKRRRNDSFGRHEEDEFRRVFREKIEQGKLNKSTPEAQYQRESPKQDHPVKQNSWGLEQMEAGYIPTNQTNDPSQASGNSPNTKRGFRGRFSKLLGHGPTQSSVIASH